MTQTMERRPFPVPIAVIGPGSQGDEAPEHMAMPTDMNTFAIPGFPDECDPAALATAADLLEQLADRLENHVDGEEPPTLDLLIQPKAIHEIFSQSLGFGEVSAFTTGSAHWRVQETAFTGLWRVVNCGPEASSFSADRLEFCPIPNVLRATMLANARVELDAPPLPTGVMNAEALIAEIAQRSRAWREGDQVHTINLTLLPVTDVDLDVLFQWLGHREVSILSRGYGNCRITSTRLANVWWVQYFNSMDTLILNSIEITSMPEVAIASREDLEDTVPRLREYLASIRAECPANGI